jgi:hypothetical protein
MCNLPKLCDGDSVSQISDKNWDYWEESMIIHFARKTLN